MLQLIACFQRAGWRIVFSSAAQASEHAVDLEALGVSAHSIELNHSSFDEFAVELQPSAVLYDRFMTEEQFGWRVSKHCPQSLQILDTEDLHCLRNARKQAVKANRSFSLTDLHSDVARREVASIWRCDLSLMISTYEMKLLQEHFGVKSSLLLHLPFMLDPISGEVLSSWRSFDERQDFMTIGNFLHAPNLDAVQQLRNIIWPMIRKQLPEAELHIYGAYVPDHVLSWHKPEAGFLVHGRTEEALEVIGRARVMLAPLRFGAGLKGKLLEAMQTGTPSVSTSIGAESMHDDHPWPGAIEDDFEAFAKAAVTLYSNAEKWSDAQKNSIDILNDIYDRRPLEERLMSTVAELLQTLDHHRTQNFTGSMLRFHTMRSTEFMSRWIEEKNRGK